MTCKTGDKRKPCGGQNLGQPPRFYRTVLSVTQLSEHEASDLRRKRGYRSVEESKGIVDPQSPVYRALPTRSVVLHHLISKTPANANVPEFQAFAIESDRLRTMDELGPDVSPFVYGRRS